MAKAQLGELKIKRAVEAGRLKVKLKTKGLSDLYVRSEPVHSWRKQRLAHPPRLQPDHRHRGHRDGLRRRRSVLHAARLLGGHNDERLRRRRRRRHPPDPERRHGGRTHGGGAVHPDRRCQKDRRAGTRQLSLLAVRRAEGGHCGLPPASAEAPARTSRCFATGALNKRPCHLRGAAQSLRSRS